MSNAAAARELPLTNADNLAKNRDTYKNAHRIDTSPRAVEPFDKEWGVGISGNTPAPSPFPRINAILAITPKTTNGFVAPDAAERITAAYREHSGEPVLLKRAYAVERILDTAPILIFPHELIAGCLCCDKKGAQVFPEFGLGRVVDEMRDGLLDYSEQRTHDYFTYTKDTQERLERLRDFWDGNTIKDMTDAMLGDDVIKGSHDGKGVFFADAYIFCGAGHLGLEYDRLLTLGLGGIGRLIEAQTAKLSLSDPADIEKRVFYRAAEIVLRAASRHIERYAALADEMAAEEQDATRAAELREIASVCRRISTAPPRSFREALQLVNFATTMTHIECNGHSVSYGRFDRYMYPFYRRDIETGAATREEIQELIENFYIKIWDLNKLRDHILIRTFGNGGIGGPCLTLGGILKDGRDGTNELTFMALDAHAHVRLPCPWLAVRLHSGSPWELKVKTANLIRMGTGEPKIFNDDITIPSMLSSHVELADARDYQVVGCVEPDPSGKAYGWKDCGHMNIARVLELAINDGRCHNCGRDCPRHEKCAAIGERLGLATGSLADFTSFEQVLEAYDKQMEYWCDRQIALLNTVDIAHQKLYPLPLLSTFMDGCIENGRDVTAGGTKYNFTGPQGVGIGTAGDGLATIKQLVFDEKRVTGQELLDAVKADWEGYEALYAYVNSDKVHHYGNDDDYADSLTKFAMDTWCKHIERRPNARGGFFQPGAYSVTVNVAHGQKQWASVEGRKAFEPVSDCMGAVHTKCGSHDIKGPTAICRSVTKLDHARATNGTLLNWKFSPGALAGETGRDNFIALIEEYIGRKGMHSQFTVANQETLIAAQREPAAYRDLLVRVAGYSAYFVELNKALQDDIIGRTSLSFD
ncbi:MAG: formate C-acetyltransferase/glycerol dehydratase family glycyl radical enzyme [Clostridiales Family XIII bacterium]|jgi:formate C-acetyltransferase|nr:formate C-acetyltransferase/glycerol dehydratase family glycyl radical enzyme [Clostridiales Family XIII bacterium]